MDVSLFQQINGLVGRNALLDQVMWLCAKGLPFFFALLLIGLWFTWRHKQQVGGFWASLSGFLALGFGQVLIRLFPRVRPYDALSQVHLLVDRTNDPSFPSDHAALAFAIATFVWLFNRKLGRVLLGFAVLQGLARVYVGAHYPSDVLGGAAVGIVASLAVWRAGKSKTCAFAIKILFGHLAAWKLAAKVD